MTRQDNIRDVYRHVPDINYQLLWRHLNDIREARLLMSERHGLHDKRQRHAARLKMNMMATILKERHDVVMAPREIRHYTRQWSR